MFVSLVRIDANFSFSSLSDSFQQGIPAKALRYVWLPQEAYPLEEFQVLGNRGHERQSVTGATGFIGSHIVYQLLAKKIKVRAVVRSAAKMKSIFPDAGAELDIVELHSLLDDHDEALKGVSAVIHTALPAFFKGANTEETFKGAYEGTLNIVNQAIATGVKKIIVTGTAMNLFNSNFEGAYGTKVLTDKDFGSVELKDINLAEMEPFAMYQAAKTVADKKLRDLSHKHPNVDFTMRERSRDLGLWANSAPTPFVYGLIAGGPDGPNTYPALNPGHVVDIRDVAKAHVLALDAPAVAGRYKRMIINTSTFKWKDAVEAIRKAHPELEERLPSADAVPPAQTDAPMDTSSASEVLEWKERIPWEASMVAAIEVCLEHERRFKA
ncbi:hypothetical protein VNI00_016839 [Paramarasmius palmivorus]|uniref:NAD(P)-binding domain-containing protein n=1 Tax=Paramarasmius palmivorus TaxID=297713 RepID=A0AAW0BBA2_9AGAR